MNEIKDHSQHLALFCHPPSAEFLSYLKDELKLTFTYKTIGELRQRSLISLPQYLRSLNISTLYLPLETESDKALLPVLATLALFTGSQSIMVINSKKSPKPLYRARIVSYVFSLVLASIYGNVAYLYCWAELYFLKRLQRIHFHKMPSTEKGEILYLLAGLWTGSRTGGAIAHIAGVVNAFIRTGWNIRYVATGKPIMISPEAETAEISTLETYALPSELNLYRHNIHFASKAYQRIKGATPAYIYARMALGNYVCVKLSRSMKAPLILEYNGSEVWVARHWGNQLRYETLARSAEEVCLRHAHLIVTVSEPLKRDLIDRGIPPSRIVFHPNGVDTDIFDPERFSIIDNQALLSQYGIEEDEIVIGFVGTFGRWHGADILAKSLVHLSQHYHQWLKISNLRLLFIGDGLMRKEVEEILRSEHYAPFTVMTGLVGQDKAAHYMAICDVLVSPHVPNNDQSPFFGSPTKLFEYLASGKPIIASNLDQIGDVLKGCPTVKELRNSHRTLQDDDSAILTEPGSVEDLADAIRYAVDNPLWRTNAGIAARDLALSKYTWEKHVGHLLPFFTDTKDDHSK